ncbi:hypothetical protein BC940DRAFT_267177 [Gongronella butleri]|nr:hypothetical protein BC940DRAFT_267177 [Gongronella butleri]
MEDQDVAMGDPPSNHTHTAVYAPLAFDLGAAVRDLTTWTPDESTRTDPVLASIDTTILQTFLISPDQVRTSDVLDTLAKLLLHAPWTLRVVGLCRPIAIDLVARVATPGFLDFLREPHATPAHTTLAVYKIELVAKTFALTLPVLPQIQNLVVSYFAHSPSLFERLHQHPHSPSAEHGPLHSLLYTAYQLVHASPSIFAPLWNWSPLVALLQHTDQVVRYLSATCLSLVYGLNDVQAKQLTHAAVGIDLDTSSDPLLATIDGKQVDVRMIRLHEEQRVAEQQVAFMQNDFTPCTAGNVLTPADLSPLTIDLCGVLMAQPIDHGASVSSKQPSLVLTDTTSRNLHAIALALSIGAPTLLEGVTGAGKTSLIEDLAVRTGRADQLVKIHLGDQTDPKVLLGTYVSTSTPGSFRWQSGVLTTAVQEGRWVLIEDIDLAPAEVISVLLPLLERRRLFIPSRGEEIAAKEGFHLFGTRSLVKSRSGKLSSRGGDLVAGANLWTRVHVTPLALDELEAVVREKFVHIGASFAPHVMQVFRTMMALEQDPSFSSSAAANGRHISTRDLIKWCFRIDALFGSRLDTQGGAHGGTLDEGMRQDLFSEAIDCFCGMIADYDTWVSVLERLGEPLQVSPSMVRHYVEQYKPVFEETGTSIRVGRVNLSALVAEGRARQQQAIVKHQKQRAFAMTNHALRLLEKIAVSVHLNEPVLLVGETGTGKTTVVQRLADMMHQRLVVVNLSQQSDSSDLLGGFKPVDGKVLAMPLRDAFDALFERTFSVKKNAKFIDAVRKSYVHQKWAPFVTLLKQAVKMAEQKFEIEDNPAKEAKRTTPPALREAWKKLVVQIDEFEVQQVQSQNKFVFSFLEGALVKAVRQGDWILMDEINLATTETLECLSGLLEDAHGSLLLTEKGDVEPIKRHPNFRLFACMNPSTDVGKRDLPPGLRNRMTEFYVHAPDTRYDDLLQIVRQYLQPVATGDDQACDDVAQFYAQAKKLAQQHKLVDGANQRPHFSIRTLARALTYVVQIQSVYGLRRSLYEGFCMTFLTQLGKESEQLMRDLIHKTLLRNVKQIAQLTTMIPKQPAPHYIPFGYFWLEQGAQPVVEDAHYIITPSVETKLFNLARVIMSRKFPVLIQGPTSAGKTSMIEYLAKKTGHRFVRINNHEHTDLQEYLGTYVSNADGQLVFQEGVLVEALRNGYWIVLDELNLAPSDVLEALNRLLDDNRELLIPETQEIVKPHPHFMLFATQNPAGLYGGRKALSRAFRNRFLELHFDDIPQDELETILSKRCQIAPSYCKRLVQVYQLLMERRQSTRIFEQRHGFITLRDLFRWAGRDANGYEELAEHGYMLLAERCRRPEEKAVVKQVLEKVMKVQLDAEKMYDPSRLEEFAIYDQMLRDRASHSGADTQLVWTKAMCRLFALVARCLKFNEPVLLVGETGCGKTTVCQMLAETYGQQLVIVNCHQNTETSDLLGGQRPVRQDNADENDKKELFAWHDGPLVQSMRDGHLFLLDEISLADDSVLERLNSVLEPSRLLVLAEKGGKHVEELNATPKFQFLATMNPGGDYGKKELSPALRNRFTEIWVPAVTDRDDLHRILVEQLSDKDQLLPFADKMLDFVAWYTQALGQSHAVISLRDMLAWVAFLNVGIQNALDPHLCFVHGCFLVLLDALGTHGASGTYLAGDALRDFREKCLLQLIKGMDPAQQKQMHALVHAHHVTLHDDKLCIGPFAIARGHNAKADVKFTLQAPTTGQNAMRVVRAMQLKKPILLEGSPGVGKTSLISALAAAAGQPLVRINLSEQTDLMDLFGSDLPVEGGQSGEFAWRDAPFLQAMKAGHWVLLDELNLASQSVLEGLNSCLDHRGAVYIPELDREFLCAPGFRVFGAQNPLQQGGGRKGLPKSFVNRFTQVYVEHLLPDDLLFIGTHMFPAVPADILGKMITFNSQMYDQTMVRCAFGRKGSPWEFNLRDVFRWLDLMEKNEVDDPAFYLETIYLQRMRTREDRDKVIALYEAVFGCEYALLPHPTYTLTPDRLLIGHASMSRSSAASDACTMLDDGQQHLLQSFLAPMASLIDCVNAGWMAIVTGPSASGKTSLVRLLSNLTGHRLEEFAMNNSVDTMELLGGFEQVDLNRHRQVILDQLRRMTQRATVCLLGALASHAMDPATALQHIRILNDRWHAMEHQIRLAQKQQRKSQGLDYSLVSSILESIGTTRSFDAGTDEAMAHVSSLVARLQELEQQSVAGKFEWIDGLLIDALEHGHWLLIDNANLCNPSVLDRLNPLFENNGVLMVNERGLVDGQVKVIKPHPNFRMFMTVDPQHGELSRAMRNRGIEIALVDAQWNDNAQDVAKLANGLGVRGNTLPRAIHDLQTDALETTARAGRTPTKNVRDYLLLAHYFVERLQRGQNWQQALSDAFYQVFVDAKDAEQPPPTLAALLADPTPVFTSFASDGNYPIFVGGAMCRQDARLAMVALQGAFLLGRLQDTDNDNDKQLDIAADFFLEAMRADDAGLRHRWLAFIHQNFSIHHANVLERVAALMRMIQQRPLFAAGPRPNNESMLDKVFRVLVRLCKNEHAMQAMQTASQRLKVGHLSTLQQSYCFHQRRLAEAQLSDPVVVHFYPLLNNLTHTILAWIDQSLVTDASDMLLHRLNDILDIADYVVSLLATSALPLDQLLILLRSLQGMTLPDAILTEADAARFDETRRVLQLILSSYDFESSRAMKQLWKHYSPATLASPSLHALETELAVINKALDAYHPQRDEGLHGKDAILHVDNELKRTLIEGIATLYTLDDAETKSSDVAKLEKSLGQLPKYAQTKLDTLDTDTKALSSWDMALLPLYDYTSLIQEFDLLAKLWLYGNDHKNNVSTALKQFQRFVLDKTSRPPSDLVPYQRLAWLLDSHDKQKMAVALPGLIQDALHLWQQRMWRSTVAQADFYKLYATRSEKPFVISNGSLHLFESVTSLTCLNVLCSVDHIGADMHTAAVTQLQQLQTHLATQSQATDRSVLELATVIASAHQLFAASEPLMPIDLFTLTMPLMDQLRAFAQTLDSYTVYVTQADFGKTDALLTAIGAQLEAHAFHRTFIDAMAHVALALRLYASGAQPVQLLAALGKARVALGMCFLACYVPAYPADPTSEPRLHVDLLQRKKTHLATNVETRAAIERLMTGNDTNATIHHYSTLLQSTENALNASLTAFSLRPDKSQLDDVFVDLRYLQTGLVDKSISTFLADFDAQSEEQDDEKLKLEAFLQREQLIQANAQQFIDRLTEKYPLYRDMLQPIVVAVDDLRHGLRLMTALPRLDGMDAFLATATRLFVRADAIDLSKKTMQWQTMATDDQLLRLKAVVFERAPASRKWAFYLRLLVVLLQQLVQNVRTHGFLDEPALARINKVLAEIVAIYKAAQVYKRQKEAEEEALFKTRAKKYAPVTDEEMEENDRKALFADFNDAFADLDLNDTTGDDEANTATAQSGHEDVKETSVLDEHDIQCIGDLHRMLFADFDVDAVANGSARGFSSNTKDAQKAYASAGQLASLATTAFSQAMDAASHMHHLRMTKVALDRLTAAETSNAAAVEDKDAAIYDFYTSENMGEAKRVAPVLEPFKARLMEILAEWPEHIILQQLVTICDRVLGFAITSPVAKFLTGLELLLQKSEDWEAYAAKHVSIQTQRDAVVALIVRWRQLELNGWPKLLLAQERAHKAAVYDHWFLLYDAVQTARVDESQQDMKELLAALDQFMQTSSLGQFAPRLALIDSFSRMMTVQARLYDQKNDALIATALRNAHQYYSQFSPHADTMLQQLRKPIERELKDFVKIATWKDINIYALKQSAQKTHRHLHKCIRKYRDVLQTAMFAVIANYNDERAMFQYGDEKKYADPYSDLVQQLCSRPIMWSTNLAIHEAPSIEAAPTMALKPHLVDLAATLRKVIKISQQTLCKSDGRTHGSLLEPFMDEILAQIKHFQKETPATLTDDNKPQVKHLKLLKKKALVDLLKELKRLGLRWRASSTLIEQNADMTRLFKTRTPCFERVLANSPSNDLLPLWRRADDYFYKCVARLSHLRNVCSSSSSAQISHDLSMLEIEKSTTATEHLFSLVTKERAIMAKLEDKLFVLQGCAAQLAHLSRSNVDGSDDPLASSSSSFALLEAHKSHLDLALVALQHALQLLPVAKMDASKTLLIDTLRAVQQAQKRVDALYAPLVLRAQHGSRVLLLTRDVAAEIASNRQWLLPLLEQLREHADVASSSSPATRPLLQPIIDTLKAAATTDALDDEKTLDGQEDDAASLALLVEKVHGVVDATLIAVQDLKKTCENVPEMRPVVAEDEMEDEDPDAMADDYIKKQHDHQFAVLAALHLDSMVQRVVAVLKVAQQLVQQQPDVYAAVQSVASQAVPYLDQYLLLSQHALGDVLLRHKSAAKMTFCMINSFTLLITKGFCSPEGFDDSEDTGDADGQLQAGTGIGEGEGAKDVSNEIEDEEQVLGTQNDEPAKDDDKKESKEEKDGLDMENDFDGQLEDVDHDDDKDDSDSDSDSDKEDPDEQIGDVDDMDPDAVDDKMWGDENDDTLKDSDKTVDQQQQQGQQQESDIVAQEEENDNAPPSDQKPEKQEPDANDQPQKQEEDDQQGGDDADGDDADGDDDNAVDDNAPGEQMQADIPEAETLELPEDLNMDGDEGEQGENDEEKQGDDQMDMDDQMDDTGAEAMEEDEPFQDPLDQAPESTETEMTDVQPEDADVPMEEDETGANEIKDDDAAPDADDQDENGDKDEQGQDDEEEDRPMGDLDQQQQQQQQGQLLDDEQPQDDDDELQKAHNREQPMSDNAANQQLGVRGETGKASMGMQGQQENQQDQDDQDDQDDQAAQDDANAQDQAGADARSGQQQQQQPSATSDDAAQEEENRAKKNNPERSLGDALENWRRRLKDVMDADDDNQDDTADQPPQKEDDKNLQVKEDHAFEYVKNDDDAHDMQTMGDAQADQTQDFLKDAATAAMDEDEHDDNQVAAEQDEQDQDQHAQDDQNALDAMPLAPDSLKKDNDDTPMGGDKRGGAILSRHLDREEQFKLEEEADEDGHGLTVDASIVAREPLDHDDMERMRDELEQKVGQWREQGRDMNQARSLWQGYENLTHDLAMGLCEQLRLILEPTLATKLKGDYRTGKRLNMKKIIPYIASQFKKDKIWLRRTKPSKRQYQVMIAIDDSKSMAENHSVQLAYEALSLISKAMSQLEVGDISITSFGEAVRLLHPFDQPFTSESGAQVIQQFTFAQQKTYIDKLVHTSLSLFDNARSNASAELWQLQLIISDGICEDHTALQALVRQAMDQRIMIIFIVIDNKPEKDSILNMTNVKYVTNNGKLAMKMTPYLETFPFQYFMVLRDINSLPEALSDALRQYFSFVAA